MLKKILILPLLVHITLFLCGDLAFSQDTFEEAKEMAETIHKKVVTDIIYTEQEIKALYYQNVQIIRLLEDIKNLLRQNLEK